MRNIVFLSLVAVEIRTHVFHVRTNFAGHIKPLQARGIRKSPYYYHMIITRNVRKSRDSKIAHADVTHRKTGVIVRGEIAVKEKERRGESFGCRGEKSHLFTGEYYVLEGALLVGELTNGAKKNKQGRFLHSVSWEPSGGNTPRRPLGGTWLYL